LEEFVGEIKDPDNEPAGVLETDGLQAEQERIMNQIPYL